MGARLASRSDSEEIPANDVSMRVDALWLGTLQQVCARAAHEVKGALNGVALNVEVVRSRSEKPGAEVGVVRSFAAAASVQLDAVIELSESLLSLARVSTAPVELAAVLRRFEGLLSPVAKANGGRLEMSVAADVLGVTTAGGNAVRLAIGSALLSALDASARVRCVAEGAGVVRIDCVDGAPFTPPADVVAAVAGAGIHVSADASAVSLRFPR